MYLQGTDSGHAALISGAKGALETAIGGYIVSAKVDGRAEQSLGHPILQPWDQGVFQLLKQVLRALVGKLVRDAEVAASGVAEVESVTFGSTRRRADGVRYPFIDALIFACRRVVSCSPIR